MNITETIEKLSKKYILDGEAETIEEINRGLCEGFASDIEALHPEVTILAVEEVMVGDDGDPSGNDRFDWRLLKEHWSTTPPKGLSHEDIDTMVIGGHFWISHEGKHYDAECPDGVKSFFDLPYFQRQIEAQISDDLMKKSTSKDALDEYPSP